MRNSSIIFFLICVLCFNCYAQNTAPNKTAYRLDKSIRQNNSIFRFWRGFIDSTKNKLIIERITNGKRTILYNDYTRDNLYFVADRNNDGYKDFITNYHDFDVIHFFDIKTNKFKESTVLMPMTFGLLDSTHKIYWGYRESQYADIYNYSVLYKYNGFEPYFYYEIKYITKDEDSEKVIRIELYKFKNGEYDNLVLIKRIKTRHPENFDYKRYWTRHYSQLLGYRLQRFGASWAEEQALNN